MSLVKLLLTLTIGTILLGACAAPSMPTSIPTEKIAFVSEENIYIINPDGTNETKLVEGFNPVWSHDGGRIAYIFEGLNVINADGTGKTKLIEDKLCIKGIPYAALTWSPDGKKITYGDKYGFYIINANGTDKIRLETSADSVFPSWSPDGKRLAYTASDGLYIVAKDGTGKIKIAEGANPRSPSWSPDGKNIAFSMDKVTGAPICGLIIGREEVMIPLRRAAGMHTDRAGTGTAYGKAWGVIFDPGKEGLAGAIQAIKVLREQPHILTDPIDGIYEIVLEEMNNLNPEIAEHLIVTKSYNALAVEINYQDTWSEDRIGFPIFGIEDAYAGTNILTRGVAATGIVPTIDYDANILFSPKARCVDEDGQFIEEYMRYGVKAFFQVMNIIWKYWKNL